MVGDVKMSLLCEYVLISMEGELNMRKMRKGEDREKGRGAQSPYVEVKGHNMFQRGL